jgi:hypothetical protein
MPVEGSVAIGYVTCRLRFGHDSERGDTVLIRTQVPVQSHQPELAAQRCHEILVGEIAISNLVYGGIRLLAAPQQGLLLRLAEPEGIATLTTGLRPAG